jgi:hypothetical protein
MTIVFLALVVVAVSVVVFLLLRKTPKAVAPEAVWWIGPIGRVGGILRLARFGVWSSDVLSIVAGMEAFTGKKITPVVVVFVEGLIPLVGGQTAAGIYHPANLWTHPWIELSVGGGNWWPKTLRDTAFEHELMHHATGLPDSDEFKALFTRYKKEHP